MRSRFVSSYWPVMALLAYPALQLVPWPSTGPITVDASATATQWLVWAVLALLYVLLGEAGRRVENRSYLVAPIVVFGCIQAGLGLVQHFTGGAEEFATGTYAEHSHFAGLMELALPFAAVLPLQSVWRGDEFRRNSLMGLLSSAPAILILLGLVYSYSRMGLVSSILTLAFIAVCWRPRMRKPAGLWRIAAPAAAAALVLVSFAPVGLMDRFGRISSMQGFAHDAHLARWQATTSLIAARPLFGSGLGTYRTAFQPYNTSERHKLVTHADNEYLELLAELGVAGFALAACFVAVTFRRIVIVYRLSDPSGRMTALAAAAAIAALLTHCFVEFQLHIAANALIFVWICALHSGSKRSAQAPVTTPGEAMEVAA